MPTVVKLPPRYSTEPSGLAASAVTLPSVFGSNAAMSEPSVVLTAATWCRVTPSTVLNSPPR